MGKIKLSTSSVEDLINCGKLSFTIQEFFWLVGLLEGEGWFCKPLPSNPNNPLIGIQTTDKDVAETVSVLCGRKVSQLPRRKPSYIKRLKPSYCVRIVGNDAVEMMKAFKPYMSVRRQAQIDKAINDFKDFKSKFSANDVREMRRLNELKKSNKEISEIFCAHPHYIYEIVSYRKRQNVKN